MNQLFNRQSKIISIWLALMCLAIIIMIFIGGLTRLTESGLSITEWNPVSGIIPPMDDVAWGVEFNKYKKSPEFLKRNLGINLQEFKSIYLLEFFHRIAGRLVGLFFIVPLLFFIFKGCLNRKEIKIYLFAFVLLCAQGVMGWYMVKSGLVSNPYVSHYRLAVHLMLAVFLYIIMFWQLMENSFDLMLTPPETNFHFVYFWCIISIILALVQMMLGAFVAGLDAGLVYNSFPMMGDGFIPHEIYINGFSLASFDDPVFVQFIHRITAYILVISICIFCFHAVRIGNGKLTKVAIYALFILILQISLGVSVLIYSVPVALALVHQLCAILLLSYLLWAYFLIKNSTM
jgi:cytochrome c oxidase assembly protein subunit 15